MKTFLPVVFIFFILVNACSKSASSTITGKWNIVSDSIITTGPDVYYNIYYGKEGDYFNFSLNGNLYIKESSLSDTVKYTLTSSDIIILTGIGFALNGVTEPSTFTFNNNKLIIVANPPGNVITPGHQYQRIITLER